MKGRTIIHFTIVANNGNDNSDNDDDNDEEDISNTKLYSPRNFYF